MSNVHEHVLSTTQHTYHTQHTKLVSVVCVPDELVWSGTGSWITGFTACCGASMEICWPPLLHRTVWAAPFVNDSTEQHIRGKSDANNKC